jgi:hypothetical protein
MDLRVFSLFKHKRKKKQNSSQIIQRMNENIVSLQKKLHECYHPKYRK